MTQQNAPVLAKHRDEAAKAAGYRDWNEAECHGVMRVKDSILAHAQDKANLEAANNRLAEIARVSLNGDMVSPHVAADRLKTIHALASGHTPSPCPGCAAKDEAMAEMRADLVEIDGLLTNAPDSPSVIADAKAIAAPYRIPPADPVADALKALWKVAEGCVTEAQFLDRAPAELKSRLPLGGAK